MIRINYKTLLIKYDIEGTQQWQQNFTYLFGLTPQATVVSPNDNIYLTGSTNRNNLNYITTLKISQCPAQSNELFRIPQESENKKKKEEAINDNTSFNLFPNPNNGNMQIAYELPENTQGRFEVYDVMGKKLLSYPLNTGENTFAITNTLSKGIYFYQAIAGDKRIKAGKIVVW